MMWFFKCNFGALRQCVHLWVLQGCEWHLKLKCPQKLSCLTLTLTTHCSFFFVQIMAWCWPGEKPLSEPMMLCLLTHKCVTRPQWVKFSSCNFNTEKWKPITSSIHNNSAEATVPLFGWLNLKRGCGLSRMLTLCNRTTYGVSSGASGTLPGSLHIRASFHSLEDESGAIYEVYSWGMLIPSSGETEHHYHKTSNISRTLGNKIVDNSDVVEASPVGAAPTTSSFPT